MVTAQQLWEMGSDARFELVPISPVNRDHGSIILAHDPDGGPDLAVEVKVQEYLTTGSQLVWVVDPRSETVTGYRPSGEARVCSGDQDVTIE